MDSSRGFGLWGALGGAGLVGGVLAFFALKPAAPPAADAPDAAVSVCEAPRHHDCSFYGACIESNVPCGPTGYALGFGEKYCGRFKDTPLSPSGAAWADSVMLCLQQSLLPYARPDRRSASCEEISEAAFDSHPACYTAPSASICFLPPEDVIAVFETIGADELFAARTHAQIQAVIASCAVQVAERSVDIVAPGPAPSHTLPIVGGAQGIGNGRGGLGSSRLSFWREQASKYVVPGANPHVRMLTPTVSEGLPPEVVQRIVRSRFGPFRLCYESALEGDPWLEGTISVAFTIGKDGKPSDVVRGDPTSMPDAGMVACVTRALSDIEYPAPTAGKKVAAAVSLVFDAGETALPPTP